MLVSPFRVPDSLLELLGAAQRCPGLPWAALVDRTGVLTRLHCPPRSSQT
jgi:hypothetical protein